MATNEQVIEIVRFVEKGIDEISARTKVMAQAIDDASKRQKVLSGLMNDPAYGRREQQLNSINKQYELMSLRMRNIGSANALADGSAAKHAKSVGSLNKQHEVTQLRLRNIVAQQGLADGSTVRHIRDVERLNREHERTQRITEYTAKYGERWGAVMHRYGGAMKLAGGAIGGAAVMGIGLAHRGMQGTVEQAKFDYEMVRLSREMAAVWKPVTELMMRGTRGIRERMEKLGGHGQDAVLGGMLVGGAAGGFAALRGAYQMIGAIAGEAMAARLSSGFGRMAMGGIGAGALGYGLAAGNVTSGAIGGAMLGGSVGGVPGAVVGGVAGGIAAKASNSPASRPGESGMQYWNRMRSEEKKTWFGTYVAAQGESISKAWNWATNGGERRSVQVSGGGFDAPGTAFDRVNAAISKQENETVKRESGPGSTAETNNLLGRILDFLNDKKGATPLPRAE